MGALDQQSLEDHILSGNGHTYRALCEHYLAEDNSTVQMQIDRTIQKLRRKHLIEKRRDGRTITWKATTPERQEFLRQRVLKRRGRLAAGRMA